jgi:4'-phosphopantetheinyl transferase EntD
MKKLFEPDPIPMRRAAYEKRQADFLKAIAAAMKTLNDAGIDVGALMRTELQERENIKNKYKKRR